ncbi:hypothetical protein EJ04DRAFT_508974 [Polyplosphaeria fusca]|uniref:Uncharacterized protein n=1 Tax=Polyplosphaeria fusca TaxID=682080 RepID=A0A9P4R5L9_9PLEO|nr:hypothetical protein EJ04DRAFT_508974 [Polyplosphaeria fusca]
MASQLMLLDECVPLSALALGSLVESIQNPIMDAYVPKQPLPPEDVLLIPAKSFQGLMSSGTENNLKVALTRLFDISGSTEEKSSASLSSMRVNRYVLRQPRQLFKLLCVADEKAREWLNDGILAGNKSYLVVELQTATNPKITRSDTRKRSADVDATIPVSAIATGGVDVLGLGAALDTGVEVGRVTSNESSKQFEAEGETIFAVGYKKVVWKSWGFKRKDVEKAQLDKEITWTLMGQKRSRDNEDEMVSVDLVDGLDAKAQKKAPEEGDEEEDEDEEDEDEDDLATLLETGVSFDGQTYLIPGTTKEA